ncbi:Interactor Protein For Cytohesin Exchange Factors 1 [Manis pentadactyla]|nr:Interactor Protein For Cytohesin Exchange Factors 1 [Manis pentadactyla]
MSWLTVPPVFDRGLRSPSGPVKAFVRRCPDKTMCEKLLILFLAYCCKDSNAHLSPFFSSADLCELGGQTR